MRVLGLLLSLKLVVAVFENQAYDAFVLVFLMAGLALLLAGREFWCGASLAFAAALKATPLIFLPYLLWKRHFVAAATFAAVFVAASYLPDLFFTPAGAAHGYFNTWLHEVVGASLDPGSAGPASLPAPICLIIRCTAQYRSKSTRRRNARCIMPSFMRWTPRSSPSSPRCSCCRHAAGDQLRSTVRSC